MSEHKEHMFRLRPLTEEDGREICTWRYPAPYDTYNWKTWDEPLANREEFADPEIREAQYRAVVDAEGALCGFAQLFPLAGTTRLGLGMRPELCGAGRGEAFVRSIAAEAKRLSPQNEIDLEVLTWNKRAIRAYERAGFRMTDTYERKTPQGTGEFHCMVWEDTSATLGDEGKRQAPLATAGLLNRNQVEWALGGSSMLALYGLAEQPDDLDLLVNASNAPKAHALLSSLGEHRIMEPKSPFCTTYFYRYSIRGVGVDLMGLFGIEHAEGVYRLDWKAERIARTKVIGGIPIPLSAMEDWYVLYSLMPGREAKTAVLERYWRDHGGIRMDLLEDALQQSLPPKVRERIEHWLKGPVSR
ncbi:GNAT family N-acetyltransferase [Paenibacillus sp. P25]|nr:GNAT family N-acetyltransferase [Paenibacillus sp. P25]